MHRSVKRWNLKAERQEAKSRERHESGREKTKGHRKNTLKKEGTKAMIKIQGKEEIP